MSEPKRFSERDVLDLLIELEAEMQDARPSLLERAGVALVFQGESGLHARLRAKLGLAAE